MSILPPMLEKMNVRNKKGFNDIIILNLVIARYENNQQLRKDMFKRNGNTKRKFV